MNEVEKLQQELEKCQEMVDRLVFSFSDALERAHAEELKQLRQDKQLLWAQAQAAYERIDEVTEQATKRIDKLEAQIAMKDRAIKELREEMDAQSRAYERIWRRLSEAREALR